MWDPHNLLNPGAVVRPRPLDADVRPLAMAAPVRPVLRLAEDRDDFARAVRRCVGVGKCRAHAGAMCPSYQVTREEKDSTRGRARVLGEMLAGEVVTAGWRSPEVREALELCLSCKACARECPVGVDVAAYKSEFLYHHYRHRIRPRAHYTLGWLPVWLKPAGVMPGLVNTVARSPLAGLLKRVAGIDRRRDLPVFATRRQRRASAADRTPLRRGFTTDQPRAVLWTDSFTLAFFPQVLADGRAVLRDAPILLLDEATSALDVTTERNVLRNIIKQRPNKTCIVTTHRPTVLNLCKRVYRVMKTHVTALDEEEASRMAMDF